jgi:spore coat protein U-like protein
MKRRFKIVGLAVGLFLGVMSASPVRQAQAATATSSFTVTTTVVASCTIATGGITFGNYDPIVANNTTPADANGTVTVACTNGTAATIGLSQGSFPTMASTAVAPARQMGTGALRVPYGLYTDAARTTVWGDVGTLAAVTYNSTGMAASTTNIYGRIAAGLDVAVGSYTDTVTATIQF